MKRASFIYLIAAAALVFPAATNAAVINFKVVNTDNVPQAGTIVCHYSNSMNGVHGKQYHTDSSGRLTIDARILGADKIVFTRDSKKWSDRTPENLSSTPGNITIPACSGAKGFSGINYSTNGVFPTETVKIVLPKLRNNPVRSIPITSQMRQLVGLINNARATNDLNRLEISTVLTNAAQNYVDLFHKNGITSLDYFSSAREGHNYNSTPHARVIDLGYPAYRDPSQMDYFAGIGENISGYNWFDANRVFQGWWNSPGHKQAILWKTFKMIGIGINTNFAVANFGGLENSSSASRAGLTGNYGDITPSIPGDKPRYIKRRIRVKAVFRKRMLAIKRTRAARGKLTFRVHRNGKVIRRIKSKRAVIRIYGRFNGRIRVAGRFISSSPVWKNSHFIRLRWIR